MSRRPESPLSSRQPRTLFPSTAAAADNERGFAVAGSGWTTRCYSCSFCGREFNSAQALGGHMNIHRRDRARLRTCTSQLASGPHQADFLPAPQINVPQSPHTPSLYVYPTRNDSTSNSGSLNAYPAPTVIPASSAFRLHLDTHRAADPSMLALVPTHPSQDENSVAATFTAPLLDLVPFRSSAPRFYKTQSEAQSVFPSIAPHASPLHIRSMLENSSVQPLKALNICVGQASAGQLHLDCSDTKAAGGPQHVQFVSQSTTGRTKRARGTGVDAITISSKVKSTVQGSCDEPSCASVSSSDKFSSLHAATAGPRRAPAQIQELIYLDLELRLGQGSASASRAPTAGNCCVRTTARLSP